MNINQILSVVYPILFTFLTGFFVYIGKEAVKLTPAVVEFIVTKIGLTNYTRIKLIGLDIWNIIEEQSRLDPIIGDTVQSKIKEFETRIKIKVPGITDSQIEDLRQAIAGEFNKDKDPIIKAIEEQVESIPAIIKYFAPDGVTELQPINTTTI